MNGTLLIKDPKTGEPNAVLPNSVWELNNGAVARIGAVDPVCESCAIIGWIGTEPAYWSKHGYHYRNVDWDLYRPAKAKRMLKVPEYRIIYTDDASAYLPVHEALPADWKDSGTVIPARVIEVEDAL